MLRRLSNLFICRAHQHHMLRSLVVCTTRPTKVEKTIIVHVRRTRWGGPKHTRYPATQQQSRKRDAMFVVRDVRQVMAKVEGMMRWRIVTDDGIHGLSAILDERESREGVDVVLQVLHQWQSKR
ncbi:hypothetical protein E1B28_004836 [Marasmius oreades]|uniref:Uncharacterized protein n=1 Tax=Marasmius oreades TaxID=181124 RepID=A0A9P7UZD8_9AGAR|nr:uncharacterized protein E1B28_004836 [Marasmius oreades]KAG7097494.1 hypothetical protein E1B28_004836 [Marasmius oreades]